VKNHGRNAEHTDVIFPVLPFAATGEPLLSASLLKATAENAGFSCTVKYFNFHFADKISLHTYKSISRNFASRSLAGDWIFSEAVFGRNAPAESSYIDHLIEDYSRLEDDVPYGVKFNKGMSFSHYVVERLIPEMQAVRSIAKQCINYYARQIYKTGARIVAFSTSCHQACSCLAVAKKLKQFPSPPVIIFGGPNCFGEMGMQWMKSFPWIDYVCTGEGEEVFHRFIKQVLSNGSAASIAGILRQGQARGLTLPRLIRNLDRTSYPDFSDYFLQLKRSPLKHVTGLPALPFESSRGCWWGQHQQCTFCGNFGHTIRYRSKSPRRVINELRYQTDKYEFRNISCVDDAIDTSHINTVFPELKRNGPSIPIYFQTRTNLSRKDVRTLREGSVTVIQPGIESLGDNVLKLMKKGGNVLQNIQLLKSCVAEDMAVSWRILFGIPGEPQEEYQKMAELIPLLTHLQPPIACVPVSLKRFSPYWENPEKFGINDVKPWESYKHIYPLSSDELSRLAYFFDFRFSDERDPLNYSRPMRTEVGKWISLWQSPNNAKPRLDLISTNGESIIRDTRPVSSSKRHNLSPEEKDVYIFCDSAGSLKEISDHLQHLNTDLINEILTKFLRKKLMITRGGKYLSLAVIQKRQSL